MAEQNQPSPARKKATAKRGPTKATALKKLGLTQEDLDLLKALKNEDVPVQGNEIDESPTDPEAVSTEFYARNVRNVEVHFRLARQSDKTKRRTSLNPRGQRGDLVKLEEGDLEDQELINQIHFGLIEIITAAEAKKIIEGQATNQQQTPHPAFASLRNELGESYSQDSLKVEPPESERGVVVAKLNPQGGGAGEIEISRHHGGINRNLNPNQVAAPSNGIISDGFAAPDVKADIIARRNDLEGPAAGLGGITSVVVGDTQRVEG